MPMLILEFEVFFYLVSKWVKMRIVVVIIARTKFL